MSYLELVPARSFGDNGEQSDEYPGGARHRGGVRVPEPLQEVTNQSKVEIGYKERKNMTFKNKTL